MTLLRQIFKKSGSKQTDSSSLCSDNMRSGQLLANRYILREMVGKGAMGSVFRAEDSLLGNVSIAVKVLSQNLANKQMADQFFKEARTGALLGHQNINIVRVLDYGVYNDSIPFYVMEYVEGGTLEQEITLQPLEVSRFLKLMAQVCSGLQSAHQGVLIEDKLYCVVHRDIKPSNIFITHNQSLGEIAKVLDFGISDLFQRNDPAREQLAMGTLAYSSGEQLKNQPPDPRSDIYSLGITMFEALTGHLPIVPEQQTLRDWVDAHCHHPPRRISEVAPRIQIPKALDELIQSCLEKDIEKRPQSIGECLDVLKNLVSSTTEGLANLPVEESVEDILDEIINGPDLRTPILASNSTKCLEVSLTDQAWRASWPANKPIAEIVFAQTFAGIDREATSLWVMLSHAKVQQQHLTHSHTEFIFDDEFRSIVAWVTVLFNEEGRLRCFPSFINLKDTKNEQMIQNLVNQGEYMLMLFDILTPTQPVKVSTLFIGQAQRKLLSERLLLAKKAPSSEKFQAGKLKLKEKYQAFKTALPVNLKNLIVN
ncbi:MAG: serine/threonine protein kinase [Acaryochloridaceae cyanobacterium RU_4_10]|nr:serine/threonine protein kinase [Acaryochloridaceae cyanobacterium RU_4_10]